MNWRVSTKTTLLLIMILGLAAPVFAAKNAGLWMASGQNAGNTRYQAAETQIGVANASQLGVKWSFPTDGGVSATPAVDGDTVYFPDWKGFIYAVDRTTGALRWKVSVQAITGLPQDDGAGGPGGVVRVTPAITGNTLIFGDQGGRVGGGAKVFALDRKTGALLWLTQIQGNGADPNDASYGAQFAIVTQSPIVEDNNGDIAYVGTASWEEAVAAFIPNYVCCTFRGTMTAIDVRSGAVLWRSYTVPDIPGYSGNGVWGSTAAIDSKRRAIYVATGNNYSVPAAVAECVATAPDDEKRACLAADNYFDSIVAMDMNTGDVLWATEALPYDAWNVNCIPGFGSPENCPEPEGPDFDFGQGPMLFTATVDGKRTDLLGAGQKSGIFWVLDRDTGDVIWQKQVGPGGTMGGIQWGSATDGSRIYTAINNSSALPWTPEGASEPTNRGAWSALDPATGDILWQTTTPDGPILIFGIVPIGSAVGALSVANDVVYGCSFAGTWVAMSAETGEILWSQASPNGAACAAGAAISRGSVFWGTGYNQIQLLPVAPSALYAFGP